MTTMSNLHTAKNALLLLFLLLNPGKTNAGILQSNPAVGSGSRQPATPALKREASGSTIGISYMTPTERDVVAEINLMRNNPARYAQLYLAPLRSCYQGRVLTLPDQYPVMTNEGIGALDECIRELERATPVAGLAPRKELSMAARDHVQDQGRTGSVGHDGSDGSSTFSRMNRYGKWEYSAGENICYGISRARNIVITLLIDDGVSSRGHRKNFLNNSFRLIGVKSGAHQVYGSMCVIDFAGGYTSK